MAKHYDEIGIWSELKLSIIRDYATAYSTILAKQRLRHMYIDGFAGPGIHLSKKSGKFVPGSPLNALEIVPPFKEFHFIDADGDRTARLKGLAGNRPDVYVYAGDCNEILPKDVFPRASRDKFARALCLLDPYNIDLSWEVVRAAGQMGTIEVFLNFMMMDMNMNVLRHNPDSAEKSQIDRMNRFWGDDSWRKVMYSTERNHWEEKNSNEDLAEAYRQRLKIVAGFKHVPEPVPMKTKTGSTIYYLYFASPNETGGRIVKHIFDKYRRPRGA